MENDKLSKFKEIVDILDKDVPSATEVAELIAQIIKVVQDVQAKLENQAKENKQSLSQEVSQGFNECLGRLEKVSKELGEKLKKDANKVLDNIKENAKIDLDTITQGLYKELKRVEKLIPSPTDLSDVFKRIDELKSKLLLELTGGEIKEKLEGLEEENRLDKKAIKGISELEEKVRQIEIRPSGIRGGARGVHLYIDGVKQGQAGTVNLIAGTNVSLTHNYAHGRNDVTISASSGSFAVIAVTGTVNDTNTVFASATEPTLVLINGIAYRATGGAITWTWVATVLTLSQPVGSGGDIYAIG